MNVVIPAYIPPPLSLSLVSSFPRSSFTSPPQCLDSDPLCLVSPSQPRRYDDTEASRIRPRPDPLSQTGLFYGLHLQKLYCSTPPPFPRPPPFAKEFFAPAHRHTATPRLFLSIRGCTRRHERGGEKQTRVCTHGPRYPHIVPARAQKSTPKSGRDREEGGKGECFRSSRLSARLSFRSRKRVSGSQRVVRGLEKKDVMRGEERERKRERKREMERS